MELGQKRALKFDPLKTKISIFDNFPNNYSEMICAHTLFTVLRNQTTHMEAKQWKGLKEVEILVKYQKIILLSSLT